MVGVLIEHDLVGVPKPVIAEGNIIRGHAKVVAAEPEALRPASRKPPNMAAAEATREASMFPGMIEMIVDVIAASIMPNPFAVGMNVRSVRVPVLVGKVAILLDAGCRARSRVRRSRASRR